MIVSFHHSYFLPWLGYFSKLTHSDVFVVLDDVGFRRNHIKRVKMLDGNGKEYWLTIPVGNNWGVPCNQVKVTDAFDENAKAKLVRGLEYNYHRAPYYEYASGLFKDILDQYEIGRLLVDANLEAQDHIMDALGLTKPQQAKSSDFGAFDDRTDRIVKISELLGATDVIIGDGSMALVHDLERFDTVGVKTSNHPYFANHPVYTHEHLKSAGNKFSPGLSFLDAVMNTGPKKTANMIQLELPKEKT